MVISRALVRRALLVLQCLADAAVERGWGVISYSEPGRGERPGIAIRVGEHHYPVEVHEVTETLPFTIEEIAAWRGEREWEIERRANQLPPPQLRRTRPTGRLRLLLPNGYRGGRASWSDGVRGPLERKLPSILRALDARASDDHRASIERARRTEELLREQAARVQRARHLRIESARVERLLSEVSA